MLGLLHQAGQAHLDELVQIARGDGEKFHAFEKRIVGSRASSRTRWLNCIQDKMAIKETLRIGDNFLSHARL